MGLFDGKNKAGNLSCMLTYTDGIENFPKEVLVNIEQNDSEQKIIIKQVYSKTPPVSLNYSQVTDVAFFSEKEITEKDKSVIGRAVAGGLLLGPLGGIIGGMSGTGKKQKTKIVGYLIINYLSSSKEEKKVLTFSMKNASYNVHSFIKELKRKLNIEDKTYNQIL